MIISNGDNMQKTLPFEAGDPVVEELFFNREQIVKEFGISLGSLKAGTHQDLALIAPRRYGKSSLLLKVKKILEKQGIAVVYFDCSKVYPFTLQETLERYLAEILRAFSRAGNWKTIPARITEAVQGIPEAISEVVSQLVSKVGVEMGDFLTLWLETRKRKKDIGNMLDKTIELPENIAKKTGIKMVILLDEFQLLSKFGTPFFWALRSRMQLHRNVAYAIAGSAVGMMKDIVGSKKSAFYNMFMIRTLEPFTEKDAQLFLRKQFKKVGMDTRKDALQTFLRKTNRIPFYLQWLGLHCYYLTLQTNTKTLTTEMVEKAYRQGLKAVPPFEREFTGLSDGQKRILIDMAQKGLSRPVELANEIGSREANVIRDLRRLVDYGYVEKPAEGSYQILDPVFADWLRMNFG